MIAKKLWIGSLVFSMLLVSTVLMPAVSGSINDSSNEVTIENSISYRDPLKLNESDSFKPNESISETWDISPQEAYRVSNAIRIHLMADEMDGLENWSKCTYDPNPEIIYDMNGKRLYYEFFVKNSSDIIGSMKVNANKTLGYAVKTLESGSNLKCYEISKKKLKEIVSEKYPNKEIVSTNVVYYCISLMGISATLKDISTGEENNIVIEIGSFEEIPENWTCSRLDFTPEKEIEENLIKWEITAEYADKLDQTANELGIDISKPLSDRDLKEIKSKMDEIKLNSQKKLELYQCNSSLGIEKQYEKITKSVPNQKILDTNYHMQENGYYCVPASAQMIAEYYGVEHSQDHIFQMMNGTVNSGVSDANSLLYYKASLPDGLNKRNYSGLLLMLLNFSFPSFEEKLDIV